MHPDPPDQKGKLMRAAEGEGPPPDEDWVHPLDAHARRDPIPGGGVRVIVMATGEGPASDRVGEGLLELLVARGRPADAFVVRADLVGWGRALEQGLADGTHPIVLVTSAVEPWADAHLDPLLKAIDARDHVIGRRPAGRVGAVGRWLANGPWRVLFALPVADPFSPCRMHRRSALERVVLQSRSRFLDVEVLAKATFLTQVIEEVAVPSLAAPPVAGIGGDLRGVLKAPVFVRPLLPTEEPEGQGEGPDGPGGQDGQGDHDDLAGPAGPFEHHGAEGQEELRQG